MPYPIVDGWEIASVANLHGSIEGRNWPDRLTHDVSLSIYLHMRTTCVIEADESALYLSYIRADFVMSCEMVIFQVPSEYAIQKRVKRLPYSTRNPF